MVTQGGENCKRGKLEGWRIGGLEDWKDGGMEGWRDGGMEEGKGGGKGGEIQSSILTADVLE